MKLIIYNADILKEIMRKICTAGLMPLNRLLIFAITILCLAGSTACKDETQEPHEPTNPLLGTWYEVGSTENKGIKVVFTETHLNLHHYGYTHTGFDYDNFPYSLIPTDSIMRAKYDEYNNSSIVYGLTNHTDTTIGHSNPSGPSIPFIPDSAMRIFGMDEYYGIPTVLNKVHTTPYAFFNDTLVIRHFYGGSFTADYVHPEGIWPIYLVRNMEE